MMHLLKNVLIFFAGAEFFHTISHAILPFFIELPMEVGPTTFTSTQNAWAIGINATIMVFLLLWASRIKQ